MADVAQPIAESGAQVAARVADKVIDKTEDFVNAAASAATNVFEAASNILTTAVDKYGQNAVDAVLWVVRVDAIQTLVTWWLWFFLAIGFAYWMWTGFSRRNWNNRINSFGADSGPVVFGVCVGTVSTIAVLWFAIGNITDVWLYTAVAKPELYLAKQAVDIVKQKLDTISKK